MKIFDKVVRSCLTNSPDLRPGVGDIQFKLKGQELVGNDTQEAPLWTYAVAMMGATYCFGQGSSQG
jgi:hypothetical protein